MADNTPAVVPGDTDDLNAFTSLFTGGTKAPVSEDKVDNTAEEADTDTEVDKIEVEDNAEDSDADEDDSPESAEDDDPGETDDEPSESKAKPKKKSVQERIDELTASRKAAEREAEVLRQELAAEKRKQLEAESKAPKPQDQPPMEATKGQPTPDDKAEDGSEKYPLGELDPSFIRDLTRWTIRAENEAAKIEQQERARAEAERQAQTQLDTEWGERVQKVEETLPNYRDTVKTMLGTFESVEPAYGNYLASTIKTMEHGPEVLYYLSNNLPEARKIVESGAVRATIALGRLEAQFAQQSAASEKKVAKKVTAAKEPPKTIRGTGGKFSVAADTDDLDAFEKTFMRK